MFIRPDGVREWYRAPLVIIARVPHGALHVVGAARARRTACCALVLPYTLNTYMRSRCSRHSHELYICDVLGHCLPLCQK